MNAFPFTKLSERPPRDPEDVARRRALFARILLPMRLAAREGGYALGLHGSAERDLDVIAAPWREGAVAPFDLAQALKDAVGVALGFEPPLGCQLRSAPKPHGREGWAIHLVPPDDMTVGADGFIDSPYVDLSILPPVVATT